MIRNQILAGAFAALSLIAASAFTPAMGQDITVGTLVIHNPAIRATPPAAKVAGGYMTITNKGEGPDRLIGGTAAFAGKVEVHEMRMDGGTMIMRPVEGGLEIPAGETVVLKPGGYHVMLMGIGEQLKPGETRKVVLDFEKAGEVSVDFPVKDIAEMMKSMGNMNQGSN